MMFNKAYSIMKSCNLSGVIENKIDDLIAKKYSQHPYSTSLKLDNIELALSQALAISQSCPYLFAGALNNLLFNCIREGRVIDKKIEATSSVSIFLSWDESGSYNKTKLLGDKALPLILNSDEFHANILKSDLRKIFKKEIVPYYSKNVAAYLKEIASALSNTNDLKRCAALLAFEIHAEIVSKVLWDKIVEIFPYIQKHELAFFELHVGENPAEELHVEMTKSMIKIVVETCLLYTSDAADE